MRHPFFAGLKSTLHISHRGGAAVLPENTLAAFERAVREFRTDMLELDVHFSRDGVAVVSHDPTVERCTNGQGAISALTFAELSQLDAGFHSKGFHGKKIRIPSLEELLAAFPTTRLNIDLKDSSASAPEEFVKVIRRAKAVDRVCIGAESDEVGGRLAALLPEACHFYPRDALTMFVMSVRAGEPPPPDDRYSTLDMPVEYQGVRLIDEALVSAAHSLGKWINVWTIDDPVEMKRLISDGVGGIMTDRPDLLRRALDAGRR